MMTSLPNLFVFESAARHASFTKASEELGMTQSAVSQRVRALEETLGIALFTRSGRSVSPTRAGAKLLREVAFAFQSLERAVDDLRPRAVRTPVTLSASTAFAAWWMAPRLGLFHAACPGIDLRLQTTDRDVDIVAEGLSLGLRAGDGHVDGCDASLLCAEVIYPVCAPAWIAEHEAPACPDELLDHRLIHLEEPFRAAITWDDWFAANGLPCANDIPGLRINDYALVLQAVLQGGGVALGWDHLVRPLIDQGLLCRLSIGSLDTGAGFYVVQPRLRRRDDPGNRVRRWMVEQARREASRP